MPAQPLSIKLPLSAIPDMEPIRHDDTTSNGGLTVSFLRLISNGSWPDWVPRTLWLKACWSAVARIPLDLWAHWADATWLGDAAQPSAGA